MSWSQSSSDTAQETTRKEHRVIFETYGAQGELSDEYNGGQDGYEAEIDKCKTPDNDGKTAGSDEKPDDDETQTMVKP